MQRRWTDELKRQIDDWECIRRVIRPEAPVVVHAFIDHEVAKLQSLHGAAARPRVNGRRATDPRPGFSAGAYPNQPVQPTAVADSRTIASSVPIRS